MADRPAEKPTEELDHPLAIQEQLAALREDMDDLPEAVTTALSARTWGLLIPYLVGTILGGFAVVVTALIVHHLSSSPLDIKRDLWDVATPAEREQIRTILFRSDAALARIFELAGPLPPPPDPNGELP